MSQLNSKDLKDGVHCDDKEQRLWLKRSSASFTVIHDDPGQNIPVIDEGLGKAQEPPVKREFWQETQEEGSQSAHIRGSNSPPLWAITTSDGLTGNHQDKCGAGHYESGSDSDCGHYEPFYYLPPIEGHGNWDLADSCEGGDGKIGFETHYLVDLHSEPVSYRGAHGDALPPIQCVTRKPRPPTPMSIVSYRLKLPQVRLTKSSHIIHHHRDSDFAETRMCEKLPKIISECEMSPRTDNSSKQHSPA